MVASLERAKISFVPIVIQYKGTLDPAILNPFLYFTGYYQATGKPLYFNELPVPALHEIRHIDNQTAHVLDGDRKVGEIRYFPGSQRLIQQVDWLDASGQKLCSDRYSMQGFKYSYCQYVNNQEKKQVFVDAEDNEVIVWDLESKQLTLMYHGKQLGFQNLTTFIHFFIDWLTEKELHFSTEEFYINNLSTPLAVAERYQQVPTTLFWQEQLREDVPGNLKRQLEKPLALRRVIFDTQKEQAALERLFPAPAHVTYHYLGPIEQFTRQHAFSKKALTVTKSDDILYLEEIAQMYPTIHWTIAAPTQVSEKLTNLEAAYENIHVQPQISEEQLEEMLQQHDWYFDFNSGVEVSESIVRAYEQNYLIFTEKGRAKNARYALEVDPEGVWKELIGECLNDRRIELNLLKQLHEKNGPAGTSQLYRQLLNQWVEEIR